MNLFQRSLALQRIMMASVVYSLPACYLMQTMQTACLGASIALLIVPNIFCSTHNVTVSLEKLLLGHMLCDNVLSVPRPTLCYPSDDRVWEPFCCFRCQVDIEPLLPLTPLTCSLPFVNFVGSMSSSFTFQLVNIKRRHCDHDNSQHILTTGRYRYQSSVKLQTSLVIPTGPIPC